MKKQIDPANSERQERFVEAQKKRGMVRVAGWISGDQREKFNALGGFLWLRKRIDAEKDPE